MRPKSTKTLRLLYVEDDEMTATAMKRWLKDHQCHVTHTAWASKAVQMLKERAADYDAIITDWDLLDHENGGQVAFEATMLGIPVRIYSGRLCADPTWNKIWLMKGRNGDVESFLQSLRPEEGR